MHRMETALRGVRRALGRTTLTTRLFAHAQTVDADTERCSPSGHSRGLVIVQIDGLSRVELERAFARGEIPTLARLCARERYRLHAFYSGLPSSTPAVQGELFYGVKMAVPAFAWRSRESGELQRMYDPSSARAIEQALAAQGEPLLAGGSAYSNIFTGGAADAHFCAASFGWSDVLKGARPHAWAAVALLHLPTLARTFVLGILESVRAIGEALLGIARGYRVGPELKFVAARVAIVVLLRDLITIGAKVDIARGLPIVHLNYIGYDEQAHRRGPGTRFAHRALNGIDRRVGALWKAVHLASHRHYDLWIYGDHGQQSTEPYSQRTGRTIAAALDAALDACDEDDLATSDLSKQPTPMRLLFAKNDAGTAHRRARLLGGSRLQRLFPNGETEEREAIPETDDRPTVVGMGPIAHVRLGTLASRDRYPLVRLAKWFSSTGGVPAVLFVDDKGVVRACRSGELLQLPADMDRLLGANHPALPDIADDLLALVRHPEAGDLVLLGWASGCEALSFAEENGAHAGAGPAETLSFALLPEDALAPAETGRLLRPLTLRQAALRTLGRTDAPAQTPTQERVPCVAVGATRKLRVMSYNVHSCLGMDGRLSPERVARVIARQEPDVIALQELDVGRTRSGGHDQAAMIAELLEMSYRFHPAIQVEEEAYGDAILTRLPVLAHRDAMLPGPRLRRGIEPRGALWVTLDLDGVNVQVLNTHLGLLPSERRVQVAELLSERWLAHPDCHGPTVLCGDLNATPESAPLKRLREVLVDVRRCTPGEGRRATFPTRRPTLAIDHLLVRDVARIERVDVPSGEIERLASDHLPLVADLVV